MLAAADNTAQSWQGACSGMVGLNSPAPDWSTSMKHVTRFETTRTAIAAASGFPPARWAQDPRADRHAVLQHRAARGRDRRRAGALRDRRPDRHRLPAPGQILVRSLPEAQDHRRQSRDLCRHGAGADAARHGQNSRGGRRSTLRMNASMRGPEATRRRLHPPITTPSGAAAASWRERRPS